jgi:hypothetical protein
VVGGGEDGGGVERHCGGLLVLRYGRLVACWLCLILRDIESAEEVGWGLLGVYRYLQE